MGKKTGFKGKVALGANKIVGMGVWSGGGITAEQIESTEFGDEFRTYEFGVKESKDVTFSGFYDPADTTGQEELEQSNIEGTDITTLRLYIDSTSYYEPCQTTGYFSPNTTTGNTTVLSHVNVTDYNISNDKSGLIAIDFTCKVSGVMVLV